MRTNAHPQSANQTDTLDDLLSTIARHAHELTGGGLTIATCSWKTGPSRSAVIDRSGPPANTGDRPCDIAADVQATVRAPLFVLWHGPLLRHSPLLGSLHLYSFDPGRMLDEEDERQLRQLCAAGALQLQQIHGAPHVSA